MVANLSVDGIIVTSFASVLALTLALLLIYSGAKFVHRGQDASLQHRGTAYGYSVTSCVAGVLIFLFLALPITFSAIVQLVRKINGPN